MKPSILIIHNYYQQPGGEDQVFQAEAELLEQHDHRVIRYTVHNRELERLNRFQKFSSAIWNRQQYEKLRSLISSEKVQVVHCHNTLPLISPAAYYAAKAEGAAVVQTLHNYRLLCPNALLYRGNKICESCIGKAVPWPGVLHACYRQSHAASAAVAAMLAFHRHRRTWHEQVDRFIALTEFAKEKFIQGGLPRQKIMVKPNFLDSSVVPCEGAGSYALFVGRLTPEKGIETLLKAWERTARHVPLKVLGEGPLKQKVLEAALENPAIEFLGQQSKPTVQELMRNASFLVFPSEWYEGFPMVIVEAYASGLPVIASNIGSMSTIISEGRTGVHFQPGNPVDLAAKVEWLLKNQWELKSMRAECRREYETRYSPEINYQILMRIYEQALGSAPTSSTTVTESPVFEEVASEVTS